MYWYLPYDYEWIHAVNLPHGKRLIREFEDRKALKAKAI